MAGNLFGGLESMGFMGLNNVKLYEEEKKPDQDGKGSDSDAPKEPTVKEEDYLFEKKMKCLVCDMEFKTKTVKTGKPRLIGSDSDLRPKYAGIDSIKYDAVVCPFCGYAALSRFFTAIPSAQAKLIKENVTPAFRGLPDDGETYTYEQASNRHKLALLNTVVKRGKNSEKAYTCLKIGWLYRGQKENMPANTPQPEEFKKQCDEAEAEMIANAYEGFVQARSKEDFPICGMDEATFDYLLADLACRTGHYEDAGKFASSVILSRTANAKLKDKARDLRDMIKDKK